MILSGKEGITLIFFVFFDQMCTTLLICISNHVFLAFFSSTNANKCHIINFLLTSLARNAQRNIGSRSFCTNLVLRARSVQRRPGSNISLYRPRVQLIKI